MPQRVLITGGLGTLGRAVAQAFEADGASVALIDLAPAPVGAGPMQIGGVDLTDAAAAARAFAEAKAALGGADVVANIAGGFTWEKVDGDPTAWRRMFDINLTSCLNMCRAAIAGLSDGGAIVNVSAAASEHAAAGMGPYAASKAAVARLTEALAAELGGRIRVNAVLPLTMDTPQNRRDMPKVDPRSWTTPAAVADAIVFLASERARAINGAVVPVTNPGV
jgi:NAD(P)-dependent dehydrogenase (short-subunit alcohol dehydrogenase family)